ncbi:MAG TPA: deoxyribonuclease V [Abditibacteriaceae bacterium]|jgi:deoxyribonuclease V
MATFLQLHDWNMTPRDAIVLQQQLRSQVQIQIPTDEIQTIAGCDISFNKYSPVIYAGIVVLRLPHLETIEEVCIVTETNFPYVPGLLSFRETPALLEAWAKLKNTPDAVMFDGQGTAHPRRFGIACHAGLLLQRPTFGCAKSVLCGRYQEPELARGASSPMIDKGEIVGEAVRTKNKVQPIFVSPGHLMDLPTAVDLTLRCDRGYRQPEPTRRAHHLVNAVRRGERAPD